MYVVRLYKDYNTNKNLGVKLADEIKMQHLEMSWENFVQLVKMNPNRIANAEVDSYGNVRLKNLNPKRKYRHYKQTLEGNLVINHYCIITKTQLGKLCFIADSDDGIHSGEYVSIGDIATTLNIGNISKLKLYNAYVEENNNDYDVYVFNGNNYRKLHKLSTVGAKDLIGDDWLFEIYSLGQDGIRLSILEHIEDVDNAVIPHGISSIGKFLGGVKKLRIPISVKELGCGCFESLDDINTVEIESGVTIIPNNCFKNSSIKEVKFSGYEKVIEDCSFASSALRGIVATSATRIGKKAFSRTSISSLVTVGAVEIGVCAFEYCNQLERVKLNDGLLIIRGGAFRGCTKLKEILIPATVRHIGRSSFKDCKRLRIARVPLGCDIGENAFPDNCKIIRY